MANLPISLEIERLVNLVKGFGWEKTSEKIEDGKVTVTLEKKTTE